MDKKTDIGRKARVFFLLLLFFSVVDKNELKQNNKITYTRHQVVGVGCKLSNGLSAECIV
jgi:hypothetical protein